MLSVILAAQLSMPVLLRERVPDVRAVFSADDMPAYVQRAGITRFVSPRTTISPTGAAQECTVERPSGDPKLDAYTCAIILKRAKFQPAKWVDGSPAYAVARVPVTWAIGSPPSDREVQKAYPPDMEISVTRLPRGAGRRTPVRLMIAVDENGRIVSCASPMPVSKEDDTKIFPELVPIACQRMTSEFTAIPAKDASGKRVRSVQNTTVVFSADR